MLRQKKSVVDLEMQSNQNDILHSEYFSLLWTGVDAPKSIISIIEEYMVSYEEEITLLKNKLTDLEAKVNNGLRTMDVTVIDNTVSIPSVTLTESNVLDITITYPNGEVGNIVNYEFIGGNIVNIYNHFVDDLNRRVITLRYFTI